MKNCFSFLVIFGILGILLISGCTQQQPTGNQTPVETPAGQPASEQPTVNLSAGNYIVDDKGKTPVLETLRFAVSLPLDYLSFTMPYPLPGTALYERVKGKISKEWEAPDSLLSDHVLIFFQ